MQDLGKFSPRRSLTTVIKSGKWERIAISVTKENKVLGVNILTTLRGSQGKLLYWCFHELCIFILWYTDNAEFYLSFVPLENSNDEEITPPFVLRRNTLLNMTWIRLTRFPG